MVKHLLLRPLILLHRCFGVAFCLLFAMWFASGIVMHFVPFPTRTESEHIAVQQPIELARVGHSPMEAVAASQIADAARVRLIRRADGPVYVVSGSSRISALRATDLSDASVSSAEAASVLGVGREHSRVGNLSTPVAVQISTDQWVVGQQYDLLRPFYRIALGDAAGTERYISGRTGELVLTTTRDQRRWNYLGSVAHWIYPTVLRSHPHVWSALMWSLALLAATSAILGAAIGILRIGFKGTRPQSPYTGWHALHHWLGLICMPFVLTWIISGWLSMDSGWLFSTGELAPAQIRALSGFPDWQHLPSNEPAQLATPATEIEWFAFGGDIYRRERIGSEQQQLLRMSHDAIAPSSKRSFLRPEEVDRALARVGMLCKPSFPIPPEDKYATSSSMPAASVFRVVCGDDWFHIDGANGSVVEQLDGSRRVRRWLYTGLHTLNFPVLMRHPFLRSVLLVLLCSFGFAFSVSAIIVAQDRLRSLR